MIRTLIKAGSVLATCGVVCSSPALAQQKLDYPSRPITLVVPFTPGGVTDSNSRVWAKKLSELLGQQVIVENKPGAGGNIGTEYVAKTKPDGYNLLYATQGTMAANKFLYKSLKVDPLRDFEMVHGMFRTPLILVTDAKKNLKTVQEVVNYAKRPSEQTFFGSAGSGTGTHLTAELFGNITRVKMTHVPYKGSAPAIQDLLGGRLDLMFDYASIVGPHIKSGALTGVAVMAEKRLPILPDIPTMVEQGYPDGLSYAWSGIVVPKNTPAEIVKTLEKAIDQLLDDKQLVEPFIQTGSEPFYGMNSVKFRQFVQQEQAKWSDLIEKTGAKIE